MNIILHKNFVKKFWKLRPTEQRRFRKRRDLFLVNPYHQTLNNHKLHGPLRGYQSINISGDLRALFKMVKPDTAHFIDIDTHRNLYK